MIMKVSALWIISGCLEAGYKAKSDTCSESKTSPILPTGGGCFDSSTCYHQVIINGPGHHKAYKIITAPSKDSDQPAHLCSLLSLCWPLCG